MKLITKFELATKIDQELHGLYRDIFNSISANEHQDLSHINILATLQNIQIEIVSRNLKL